jgi:hypothetical protein
MASPPPNIDPTFTKEEIKRNLFKSPSVEGDRIAGNMCTYPEALEKLYRSPYLYLVIAIPSQYRV